MAGQKKKLIYSEETPWFPEYYIGWIGIINCGQRTSDMYITVELEWRRYVVWFLFVSRLLVQFPIFASILIFTRLCTYLLKPSGVTYYIFPPSNTSVSNKMRGRMENHSSIGPLVNENSYPISMHLKKCFVPDKTKS